jgi:hypothetical protein
MFRQSCRGCHLPGAAYSLDMSTRQGAYVELVGSGQGGPAEFITCAENGYMRVVPFDPDGSLLVQKLEDTQPCGDQMPPGGKLSNASLALVRAWIAAGALND